MTTTTTEAFETGLRAEFEAWKRTQIDQDAWSAVLWATERAAKQEWQPIETAPMEGVVILVAGKGWAGTDYIVSAYYDEEHRGWWESNTHYTDATDGQVYPTHWMPLPDAPNAAAIRASSGKGDCDV